MQYNIVENSSQASRDYTVCPGCDLLLERIAAASDHSAVCPRCGSRLYRARRDSVNKTLALSLTGLLLYVPANFTTLLTFDVLGTPSSTTLFASTLSMFAQGQFVVGTVVVLTGLVFPLLTLSLLFTVSLGLHLRRRIPCMPTMLRWYHHLTEWAMEDVYLIGVFVTIIKMSHMATIEANTGLYCFIALVLVTIASQSAIDFPLFWSRMEPDAPPPPPAPDVETAMEAGLMVCHTCRRIAAVGDEAGKVFCPRCGEQLHFRKPESVGRTWALVLTAVIFTFPANLLPIMEVEYMGVPDRSTIMDGIIYFFHEGSYGIGAIILTASILVPMFKILGLALILLSIHFRRQGWLRHKAMMFRFIQFIGRWSMLDIFVIALLCALVRFGYLSTVNVAPAAFYFTGVVLATMFSAINFDPRLLWDDAVTPVVREYNHATARSS